MFNTLKPQTKTGMTSGHNATSVEVTFQLCKPSHRLCNGKANIIDDGTRFKPNGFSFPLLMMIKSNIQALVKSRTRGHKSIVIVTRMFRSLPQKCRHCYQNVSVMTTKVSSQLSKCFGSLNSFNSIINHKCAVYHNAL